MNPRSMQWQMLAAKAVEGTLSDEELDQLTVLCKESPEARHALSRVMMVERLLPLAIDNPMTSVAAQEAVMRIEHDEHVSMEMAWKTAERARRWLWKRKLKKVAAVAAAAAVFALAAWGLENWNLPPASVMRSEGMIWVGAAPKLDHPELVRGQRLRGANGLLEIGFRNGARVVMEGPFDMEVLDQDVVYLYSGRVSVRCPSSAHGFKVKTKLVEVVDLGTEFCVDQTKQDVVEVHVLEGAVEARSAKLARTVLLEGEAVRVNESGLVRMGADSSAFVTEMPNRNGEPMRYIHWSFDEDLDHAPAANNGAGLGVDDDTSLYLKQLPARSGAVSEEPKRSWGVYGKGLSLTGKGGYAETPFPGIAGNQARSIALWVRVPRDLGQFEGHGIVSWGTISGPRAWQLSANMLGEGPLGRLRIGTYEGGCIVGSTDLRDGLWHHVAVVMYGGSRPNLATNVLLYVDGKKETVTRRTLTEIQTNVLEAGHGVWMGRCITYTDWAAGREGPRRFFRGDVDEVYIVDAALSQEQIQRMIEKNEPPN